MIHGGGRNGGGRGVANEGEGTKEHRAKRFGFSILSLSAGKGRWKRIEGVG